MRAFISSIARVSAPERASICAERLARNSSVAISALAMATSTTANWPNSVASTSYTSRIATMFAPPPIQLPASAAMPFQVSPATAAGQNHSISWKDTRAPSTMPKVPATKTNNSLGPRRRMPLRSIDSVSSTSAAGSSTRLATGL